MTSTASPASPELVPGRTLESLELPAISRTTLALFAGASGDHNPIHIDLDNARSAGYDDVFAQGMLSMGYLGRYLSEQFGQERIRTWGVRFTAITPVHAVPTCTGVVRSVDEANRRADVDLTVTLADGTVTLSGWATIDLTTDSHSHNNATAHDTATEEAR